MEIIVPYDKWAVEVGELASEFPEVRFPLIADLGSASSDRVACHQHRLYDRRRAAGLAIARGQIVAMTEDHAVPAADWCRQIMTAHEQPYAVIGGAINNGINRPLNWAWYYCDFGRYGSPVENGPSAYLSDVNVAYKRSALESVKHLWNDAYQETTVHWALRSSGAELYLDGRMVVDQHRPAMSLGPALRERIEWGRIFAETRAAAGRGWRRFYYAAGTPLLPFLLFARACGHMRRQRRTPGQIITALPVLACLLTGWALGELIGYVAGPPESETAPDRAPLHAGQAGGL